VRRIDRSHHARRTTSAIADNAIATPETAVEVTVITLRPRVNPPDAESNVTTRSEDPEVRVETEITSSVSFDRNTSVSERCGGRRSALLV
jgi:hypothetical protein